MLYNKCYFIINFFTTRYERNTLLAKREALFDFVIETKASKLRTLLLKDRPSFLDNCEITALKHEIHIAIFRQNHRRGR